MVVFNILARLIDLLALLPAVTYSITGFATMSVHVDHVVCTSEHPACDTLSIKYKLEQMCSQGKNNLVYISGSFTAHDKIFDNSKSATIDQNNLVLIGVSGDDDVTLDNIIIQFISPGVGVQKPVFVTDASLAGNDADSYQLSLEGAPVSTADILGINYLGGDGRGDHAVTETALSMDGTSVFVWLGTISNDWFDESNWNIGAVPQSTDHIAIIQSEHLPVIGASEQTLFIMENIAHIFSPANLIIKEGALLIVEPTATINTETESHIIIKPDALFVNFSNSKPQLEVQKLVTGSAGWRNISSPVRTSYADITQGFVTQGFQGSEFPELQPNLIWWDETYHGTTLQHWRQPLNIQDTIVGGKGHFYYVFNGGGILNPDGTPTGDNYSDSLPALMTAKGVEYAFNDHSSFNFEVTFTPVQSSKTQIEYRNNYTEINIANEGWNLIGNPAASVLDWDKNSWTKINIDNTIYVWDPDTNHGEYLTWNGSAGSLGSGLLDPFTAFWVRTNNSEPLLSFTNEAKTINVSKDHQGNEVSNNYNEIVIPIKLSAHDMKTTSYICLNENGVIGHDPYDAYRLEPMTKTWIALYMNSSPAHNLPLIINNLPLKPGHEMHIPLYVNAMINNKQTGGDFKLQWDIPCVWPHDLNIFLMDHNQEKAISMLKQNNINFSTDVAKTSYSASVNPLDLPETIINTGTGNIHNKACSQQKGVTQWQPFTIIITQDYTCNEPDYFDGSPLLMPIYPNPFKNSTRIAFRLSKKQHIRLEVIDVHGRLLDMVTAGTFPPGITEIIWTSGNHPSGLYYFRLLSDTSISLQKGILLRR